MSSGNMWLIRQWFAVGLALTCSTGCGSSTPKSGTGGTERPLLITHTKSAIVVIGTSPSYGWRAVLPLR
jgi:hypothetical protein